MSLLNVITFPNPNLRIKAKPVDKVDKDIKTLIKNMFETMYEDKGIGLAATQVDVHQRIIVIDLQDGEHKPIALINPEILEKEGEITSEEGCLSVPDIFAKVKRAEKVKIKALDEEGKPIEFIAEGHFAVCLQHEIDHINGTLFIDYLSPLKQQMVRKKIEKMQKAESRR